MMKHAEVSGCSAEELARLAEARCLRSFEKGSDLFREGDAIEEIHCIHTGSVALVKRDPDNTLVTVHIAGAGDTLGVAMALNDAPYSTGARAITPTLTCMLPKPLFLEFARRYPRLVLNAMQNLCNRLEMLERHIDPEMDRG